MERTARETERPFPQRSWRGFQIDACLIGIVAAGAVTQPVRQHCIYRPSMFGRWPRFLSWQKQVDTRWKVLSYLESSARHHQFHSKRPERYESL